MTDAGRIMVIPKGKYNASITYEKLDAVTYNGKGFIALKTVSGVTPTDDGTNWRLYVDNADIDASNLAPTFTVASTRENINSGEKMSTLFGKVMKYFTDIKGHAYKDLVTNATTTTAGSPLDATVAKTLNDSIGTIKNQIGSNKDTIDEHEIIISMTINHNLPRITPKDITSYISDGSFYKRLNGSDGYSLFEDIFVGDYIKMSRAISAPNQDSSVKATGSQYVTIIGLDTLMGNGDGNTYVNYHHAIMTPGQGFGGTQHFGRHRMNPTNTTTGGYVSSEMNTAVIGAVATSGSTADTATINQQLYAEFGSHLATTRELVSNSINATGTNRFGAASGCSNNWAWTSMQAVLMSEVEVYGSIVWSSSGYDTGNAKMQMPLFAHNRQAINNKSSWYWLKDIASAAGFCACGSSGDAGCNGASYVDGGVRPRFVIKA